MEFDRNKLKFLPLSSRKSKSCIEDILVNPDSDFQLKDSKTIENIANQIFISRERNKPLILAFGAHLIKNGLSLVLKKMIEKNYITHLATNGASSIHDWEIAFHGKTEEDVREYIQKGQFGIWEETGKYINLALISGASKGKGYGESICEMIHKDRIIISEEIFNNPELKEKLKKSKINPGEIKIEHPFKAYSLQNFAFENKISFTVHPGFGYDIIYTHPVCDGASIGKTAEIDFLRFVNSISDLEGGVYISIGSSIMSPMIFEKSLSMARNIAHQSNRKIEDFMIVVNDIQEGSWDWSSKKEPDKNNPAYYLRFCKTFSRMNSREFHYIQDDNRNFLLSLYNFLKKYS